MKDNSTIKQKLSTSGRQMKRILFWVPDVLSCSAVGLVGKTLRWVFALFLFIIVASYAIKSGIGTYMKVRIANKVIRQIRPNLTVSEVSIEGLDYRVVKSQDGTRVGLQGETGEWVLPPKYLSIEYKAGFWISQTTEGMGLFDEDLHPLLPCNHEKIDVQPDFGIFVTDTAHVRRLIALDAKTELRSVSFSEVCELSYKTKHETSDEEEYRYYTACAYKYYSDDAHSRCGLLSTTGTPLTPPVYTDIRAVGPDLFFCLPQGDVLSTSVLEREREGE